MATTVLPRATTYPRSRIYEWLTTTDHKKIGIMYVASSYFFMCLGGLLALGIRTQLAVPNDTLIPNALYNQLFTMHGTTMIFFFVMPMLAGFANYAMPLMIGAADMAFPRINALSFWIIPVERPAALQRLRLRRRRVRRLDVLLAAGRGQVLGHRAGPVDPGAPAERHELDPGRHQHAGDDLQAARPGHDDAAPADLRVDRPGHGRAAASSPCRSWPAAW